MNALQKLKEKNLSGKFICVGLDTDEDKIPAHLKALDDPVFEFNKGIIEKTKAYSAAYKLNFAFYERNNLKGLESLVKTISIIPKDILIIADAKRGDIGNTSRMYAKAILENLNFDSITVNPYMGEDSISPFLENPDKLIFILSLTSNAGAEDLEKLKLEDGSYLFQKVITKVHQWNKMNNCGIVFGATKSKELTENIELFGNLPVLLPGIGAQGGSLKDVVLSFKLKDRRDFIINVSRGIIYKSNGKDFADAAKEEIISLNNIIKNLFND